MTTAIVAGTVVGTARADTVPSGKYLLVDECSLAGARSGRYLVAYDATGQAGTGEMVLVSQGSSARQTERTKDRPIDTVIVGIVDEVTEGDGAVYRKRG